MVPSGGTGSGPRLPPLPPTHLEALRVDLLALLVPGHPWLGVPRGLTHKGGHTPRHADLVLGFPDEPGGLWGQSGKKKSPDGPGTRPGPRGHTSAPSIPRWPGVPREPLQDGWREEDEGEEMLPLTPTPPEAPVRTRLCTGPRSPPPGGNGHTHAPVDTTSRGLACSVPQRTAEREAPEILGAPNSAPGGPSGDPPNPGGPL